MNTAPVGGVGQQMLTQVGTFPLPPLFIALIQSNLSLDRFQHGPTCCSARGLHADQRDKILKWLDTAGSELHTEQQFAS